MKQWFLSLLTLSVAINTAVANTGETREILFTGSNPTESLTLTGEETHTEYRPETRANTCYRTVIAGYRTVCTGGGYGGGYPGPRPYPGPGPRPYPGPRPGPGYCSQQPIYRQVPYTCYETVQVPYEVHDYDTVANINISFGAVPAGINAQEKINVMLSGSALAINATGSKALILDLVKHDVKISINGNVKTIDVNYKIEFTDASLVLSALNSMNASINYNVLTYDLGALNPAFKLNHSLKLVKVRPLASDIILFDRALTTNELAVTARGERTEYVVDFKKLGSELSRGKFSVNVKSSFAAKGIVLNALDFGESLLKEKTIIYKIR